MENEKRLIDASVLIRDLTAMKSAYDAITLDGIIKALKEEPTMDAVEVVRCKDCKHRGEEIICPMCFGEQIEWDDDGYSEIDWFLHDHTHNDGFCDRGERIADDGR